MKTFAQDPLRVYDDAYAAMEAVTDLVTTAMGTGDETSRIAYGVGIIFDQQMATFAAARELLKEAVSPVVKKSAVQERRVVRMGINAVQITEPDGRRWITSPEAAGLDPVTLEAVRAPQPITRVQVLSDLARDPEAASAVAKAVGVKTEMVEKVIGQLLSRSVSETADGETSPVAVNQ